jgi:hypothetical protein
MTTHTEPVVPTVACRNCGSALSATQRFCGQCGQKSPTGRLRTYDLLHELLHAFTHVDNSFAALLRALVRRPGRVAREYVAGHRKRYFGPFAFLVIMAGVSTLVIQSTGFVVQASGSGNAVSALVQKHVNLVMLLQVPVLALWCMLLFRRDKLHFAEHAVLAAYLSGIRTIFFLLIELPIFYLVKDHGFGTLSTIGYLVLWLGYFGFGASQFYTGHRLGLWLRGVLAAVLTQLTAMLVIGGMAYLYFGAAALRG